MEKVNDMKTKKKKMIPEFPIPIEDRFPMYRLGSKGTKQRLWKR